MKTALLTASIFPGCCGAIGFLLSAVAWIYGSLSAIPLSTQVFHAKFVYLFFLGNNALLMGTC